MLTIHFSGVMLIMTPKDESLGCLGKDVIQYLSFLVKTYYSSIIAPGLVYEYLFDG